MMQPQLKKIYIYIYTHTGGYKMEDFPKFNSLYIYAFILLYMIYIGVAGIPISSMRTPWLHYFSENK